MAALETYCSQKVCFKTKRRVHSLGNCLGTGYSNTCWEQYWSFANSASPAYPPDSAVAASNTATGIRAATCLSPVGSMTRFGLAPLAAAGQTGCQIGGFDLNFLMKFWGRGATTGSVFACTLRLLMNCLGPSIYRRIRDTSCVLRL